MRVYVMVAWFASFSKSIFYVPATRIKLKSDIKFSNGSAVRKIDGKTESLFIEDTLFSRDGVSYIEVSLYMGNIVASELKVC